MRLPTTFALVLGLASAPACDVFSPGSGGPHGLWIGETGVVMDPGEEFTFTASFQEHGIRGARPSSSIEPATDARWWTEDTEVIRMPSASRGTVEALAPGSATVWVELGARRDSANVTVLAEDDWPTHRWKAVSTSVEGACALDEAGQAYCWGADHYGVLGTAGERRQWTASHRPVRVRSSLSFAEIGKGDGFACARTAAGEMWCWGYHNQANLGHGRTRGLHYETAPVRVRFPGRVKSLAVGARHSCLLDEAGKAYCWGGNLVGELGIEGDALNSGELGGRTVPVAFEGTFREIYAGPYVSCGVTPDGELYCWGATYGGSPEMGERNPLPSRVAAPVRPHRVHPGGGVSSILSADGRLFMWGFAQLEPYAFHQSPVPADTEMRFSEVSSRCALDLVGQAWCWGSEAWHLFKSEMATEPCGSPSILNCTSAPVKVPGGHRFRSFSESRTACAVTPEEELYCWGQNQHGQLGIGRPGIEGIHIPQRVLDPL